MGRRQRKRTHSVTQKSKRRKKISNTKVCIYHDSVVKENWDTDKTVSENYKLLGLKLNPNKITKEIVEPKINIEESVPEPADPKGPKLSHAEIYYFRALIKKYGQNYKAMKRDIKLNFYQHTKPVLKKKCELYELQYRGGRFDIGGENYNPEDHVNNNENDVLDFVYEKNVDNNNNENEEDEVPKKKKKKKRKKKKKYY
eukprot:TRINITY_DN11577_c0_g1_i1.p1 TRINITY_DN11577_c0_g1~~TRINITY_DN11577_c0_g1_i1.p1  ORF type:complete len:199 (+),score=22.06 TRINITY_DN11577_c0_g1_i1:121-717(+)